ncbi:hypothetical protein LOC68_27055 [Blastopirellula sp. JC732]|uniref:ScyD/ScyE family protein n=1 Tax=Blastopirellula sediminis TaxID=2894196 RepID=A0A9X1SMV0_9BACT|nr:hypothetical protein [Blastopirellula sediminis]MCC9604632.1 hypothetical protein [Blastopirellula sediminis]MCC9632069.1 hypothetical protein [Blastopirellula sediminis]
MRKYLLPLACLLSAAALLRADVETEVVIEGLANPTGVAVEQESGDVYIAESAAGRVARIEDGKAVDVVTGFSLDKYGMDPTYDIGPLGLAFLDQNHIVVSGGGDPDGEDFVAIYEFGQKSTFDKPVQKLGPLVAEGEVKGEGNFYGVAVVKLDNVDWIVTTSNGDDEKGWLAAAEKDKSNFKPLIRYIATKELTKVDAPAAITISPRQEAVVGQMGEIATPGDSLLTFYDVKEKGLLMSLPTGLSDIVGLAYSPKTGRLYAVDFSWHDPSQGGLFRIDAVRVDGKQAAKATKIIDLMKPTALDFAKDGTLYITEFGEGEKGGRVLKIQPGL